VAAAPPPEEPQPTATTATTPSRSSPDRPIAALSHHLLSSYETRNLSVVRAREPPWLATSATERPLPRAAAGTMNEHLAAEPSQTRRTFR